MNFLGPAELALSGRSFKHARFSVLRFFRKRFSAFLNFSLLLPLFCLFYKRFVCNLSLLLLRLEVIVDVIRISPVYDTRHSLVHAGVVLVSLKLGDRERALALHLRRLPGRFGLR